MVGDGLCVADYREGKTVEELPLGADGVRTPVGESVFEGAADGLGVVSPVVKRLIVGVGRRDGPNVFGVPEGSVVVIRIGDAEPGGAAACDLGDGVEVGEPVGAGASSLGLDAGHRIGDRIAFEVRNESVGEAGDDVDVDFSRCAIGVVGRDAAVVGVFGDVRPLSLPSF